MNDTSDKSTTRLRLGRLAPDNSPPPPSLPQFEHVSRYWDNEHSCYAARLLPGEYYVTRARRSRLHGARFLRLGLHPRCAPQHRRHEPLHAAARRIEGRERLGRGALSAATRYGNVAMERLINDILKLGGRREDLEIKLVGGGRVLSEMSNDVGARNIDFVRQYVRDEGFRVLSEDLGDVHARRVVYFPQSGRMRVRKLNAVPDETLVARERQYLRQLDSTPTEGGIELF